MFSFELFGVVPIRSRAVARHVVARRRDSRPSVPRAYGRS